MTIFILGLLCIPLGIFLNVLLFHFLIRIALRQIVKPTLEDNKLKFIKYKWAGFWSCGDFKNDKMEFALFKTGLNTLSIYSQIYYKDSDVVKRITIKIYAIDLQIDKVEFSREF